jgi:hypothetical protein
MSANDPLRWRVKVVETEAKAYRNAGVVQQPGPAASEGAQVPVPSAPVAPAPPRVNGVTFDVDEGTSIYEGDCATLYECRVSDYIVSDKGTTYDVLALTPASSLTFHFYPRAPDEGDAQWTRE